MRTVQHWIVVEDPLGTPTDVHTVYSEPYRLPEGIVVIERPKE